MIIDSHCHLDFDKLNVNLDKIINDASNAGVKYLLTICTDNKSFNKILDEMIDFQQNKVLKLARELIPHLTPEDIRNPQDFPELEKTIMALTSGL